MDVTIFIKHFRVEIMAFPFVLFHRNIFFNLRCLFRQRFSAAYLLKLVLLPQRVSPGGTNLSLLAGVCAACMCPDEVVCSRDGCRHSVAQGTVDVPVRLFRQRMTKVKNMVGLAPAWIQAV